MDQCRIPYSFENNDNLKLIKRKKAILLRNSRMILIPEKLLRRINFEGFK